MPVEYAEVIDGLTGQWMATGPTTGGSQISPYPTGAGGGYAVSGNPVASPPVGGATWQLDLAYEAETYTTPTGARAWKPTAADDALIDYVTSHPYSGVDELLEAQGEAAVKAAGRGIGNLPYVGDVVGGAVEGAMVYGRTGSVTHGVLAGGGATAGGIVGTAIGAGLGAALGPVGVGIGGIVGGAIGGAVGSAIGQGIANLIVPINPNGATFNDGLDPFNPNTPKDYSAYGGVNIRSFSFNNGQQVNVSALSHTITTETFEIFGDRVTVKNISYKSCDGSFSSIPGVEYKYSQGGYFNGWGPMQFAITGAGTCAAGEPYNEDDLRDPKLSPYDPTKNPNRSKDTSDPTELPGPQPNPNPRPGPRPGPTPTPINFPLPIGGPVPTGQPVPGADDKKQPYPTPSPNPNPDPPNPNPTEQPGPGAEPCDPCVELAAIRAKLEETFSLAWALPDCGTDFQITRTGENEGQGLAGLSQKIDGLYQILRVLHDNTRCDKDSFVVIPDSWPVKVGSDRPQLILIYASKNPDKTWGSRRYEFVVPHFDGKLRKALKTLVPKEIKKGSEMGTYTLADNSKIITYCKTKTEAMRILNAFDKLVLKDMRTTNKKTGEINPNTKFLELTLYPFEARYFSQGQQNPNPDWKDKLF